MNKSVALSFYMCSTKSRLRGSEKPKSGWQLCKIYDGRHFEGDLGCGGSMHFIRLSDGRIVATNDFWHDTWSDNGWSSSVPNGAIIGVGLETRMCRPKSRKALELIMSMIDDRYLPHRICLKSGLSDSEAYNASNAAIRFDSGNGQLPECKRREYSPIISPGEGGLSHASFSSPEGAHLTHIKIGDKELQPLVSRDQLKGLKPSSTPVYILYTNDDGVSKAALEKGDAIDECYVYDKPGW